MSIGGGKSVALEKAVDRAVDAGVHFSVVAGMFHSGTIIPLEILIIIPLGSDNRDACGNSPAGAAKAVTASASTIADERAPAANYGRCVDIFAPGLHPTNDTRCR
jgi:cerevisin